MQRKSPNHTSSIRCFSTTATKGSRECYWIYFR